jgi:hypothetical protein
VKNLIRHHHLAYLNLDSQDCLLRQGYRHHLDR